MLKKSVLSFTLKELNALIQDEKARVVLQRSIRKLPLQPYCLSDLRGSIQEILDANLAKFDHELKGILLSYKNIKIVKNLANVLYDDSRLHLTVQVDFYLFMPEVGCILRGIVNKRSADHIGCLVHKAFNVSIPRPESETDGDWQGYYVEIGQEVTFRVESLDLTGSLPYMLGCLLEAGSLASSSSEALEEQKTAAEDDIVAAINKFSGSQEPHEDPYGSLPTTEHKKKKKHKKYSDLESGANVQDLAFMKDERDYILEKGDQEHDVYGSVMKTPKKKKRKNTEQMASLKQEEQACNVDNEGGTNYHNQKWEERTQYEEKILHNENQIDSSFHSPEFDHLNSNISLKKKVKRKYNEAFYDNENHDDTSSTQNESVKHKKKKRKKTESHSSEMPTADGTTEEEFSIDTSQELTNQDNKRKKKKKRDASEEISSDLREEIEFYATGASDNLMAKDKLLITSPDIDNPFEKQTTKMPFSQELFKKLSKKVKPHIITELVTSTPVEEKTKKEKHSLSRSKFSGTDGHSDFKQSKFLESVDQISLLHSPIFKGKHPKKEHSPTVQSDTVPVKVKRLKKEKGLNSNQENTDKIISEDYQLSGSLHALYRPKSSLSWSDTDNMTRGPPTLPGVCSTSLTALQIMQHKTKKGDSAQKHLINSALESPVETKVKMSKKESRLSIKKKDVIGSEFQCEESGKGQVTNSHVEYITNIKKQPSITRKCVIPPGKATSSLVLGENTSEEGNSSGENNVKKSVFKLSGTSSSERSPRHSWGTVNNQSCSHISKSFDRACSPDSGLSLSAASGERDSRNLTDISSKKEADSMDSGESPKFGRHEKEQVRKLPKTPKRKKITEAEEGSSHLIIKHKIKKEKESPLSGPSSRHETESTSRVRGDGSLEAEKLKILADMIKKLGDGSKEEISVNDESHKSLNSSTIKAKQQSKQEDTISDSDLDTSKSKKLHRRKDSNKFKVIKSSVAEADNRQPLDATSDSRHSAEKLSHSSTAFVGAREHEDSRNYFREGSPISVPAKISVKTPRRKSSTGTEGSSSKLVTKTSVKVKEKESAKKTKVISTSESENREGNFPDKESAGALAERLLQEFLQRKSF